MNTSAPDMVFGGTPGAFLTAGSTVPYPGGSITDAAGSGYLRLTSADTQQRGYAYNNNSFPAINGLKISFEYYTYGGDGADGICFFLFDATTPSFQIGGFGGSLGYTRRTNKTPQEPGLNGGYLGIGIDEYGNFYNYNEGRYTGPGGAILDNTVAIRGKGDGSLDYWYNNVSNSIPNYDYITHAQTTALPAPFTIQGGMERFSSDTQAGYRRVEIDLAPRTITVNSVTGTAYTISVRIVTGSSSGPVVHNVITGQDYNQIAPENLKFGYAASTGGSKNYHEIRNIYIRSYNTVSNTPVATNNVQTVCGGNTTRFLLRSTVTPVNLPLGLDSNSIRFINPANSLDTSDVMVIPGAGTIRTDSNGKGYVSFTAAPGFTSGSATVRYVMNDNYGALSNAAILTLNAAPGITSNTITAINGNNTITGSTPSTGAILWQESITGSADGYYAAPGTNNTLNYTVQPSAEAIRWYRRSVTSGNCTSYSNVKSFSDAAVPLPVVLTSFTAVQQQSSVSLSWSTAEERDIDYYVAERSADGHEFIPIGLQKSKGGTQPVYQLTDNKPLSGMGIYRIAVHAKNGIFTYSPVAVVNNGNAIPDIILYPNPAEEKLYLNTGAQGSMAIYSHLGVVVKKGIVVSGTNAIDIASLPAGAYYLVFRSGDATRVKRFSKLR